MGLGVLLFWGVVCSQLTFGGKMQLSCSPMISLSKNQSSAWVRPTMLEPEQNHSLFLLWQPSAQARANGAETPATPEEEPGQWFIPMAAARHPVLGFFLQCCQGCSTAALTKVLDCSCRKEL